MLLLLFHFLTRKSWYKLIFSLNHFCRSWTVLSGGAHKHKVNGILGLLCRDHFPGLVHYQGRYEPAWTWDHYIAANNNQLDRSGRAFENKADLAALSCLPFGHTANLGALPCACRPGTRRTAADAVSWP